MFLAIKRVAFPEKFVEILPAPILGTPSDGGNESTFSGGKQLKREEIEAEDGHATPIQRRRKRRREWVWPPLDDNLVDHDFDRVTIRENTAIEGSLLNLEHFTDASESSATNLLPEPVIEKDDTETEFPVSPDGKLPD